MVGNCTCNGFINGRNCFCCRTISHKAANPRELACGSGNLNCHCSHGHQDGNAYAGAHSAAEPYTRGDSRTAVCHRRTDKHTNSDSDGAPPHKTPEPTPKNEKSRLTRASRRIFPLTFPTEANSNSLCPSATVDRTGNPTILLTSVVLQSLGPPF